MLLFMDDYPEEGINFPIEQYTPTFGGTSSVNQITFSYEVTNSILTIDGRWNVLSVPGGQSMTISLPDVGIVIDPILDTEIIAGNAVRYAGVTGNNKDLNVIADTSTSNSVLYFGFINETTDNPFTKQNAFVSSFTLSVSIPVIYS